MNEEMDEWVNGASDSEDKEARGPKAVQIGQVGTPEQFPGENYKTEIFTTSSKHKPWTVRNRHCVINLLRIYFIIYFT